MWTQASEPSPGSQPLERVIIGTLLQPGPLPPSWEQGSEQPLPAPRPQGGPHGHSEWEPGWGAEARSRAAV